MLTAVTVMIIAYVFFLMSIAIVIVTARVRRSLLNKYLLLPAKISHIRRAKATLEWTFRGQVYTTSPMGLYAIRRGDSVNVFLTKDTGRFVRIDLWTENYKWGYAVAGIFAVAGAVVTAIGALM